MSRFHSLPRPALLALRFLSALVFTATLLLALVAALDLWPAGASAAPAVQEPAFDCETVSGILKVECQALVSLYNDTDGPNWTNKTDWLATKTPCSWHGVACNAGTVIGLDLHSNNLSGRLPSDLGKLANLTALYLQFNQLSDSIPPELGSLTAL